MKRIFIFAAVLLVILVLITIFVVNSPRVDNEPFYVGVTFGGNTTDEAKLLIDKVKNYTNLFVLQSGTLKINESAVVEIGDYAVSNGLHFAAYFDTLNPPQMASWIGIAEQRWGDMFAGVYYGDEPGGKMLDAYADLSESPASTSNVTTSNVTISTVAVSAVITKNAGGGITIYDNYSSTTYQANGEVIVSKWGNSMILPNSNNIPLPNGNITTYYPNGTIILMDISGGFFTMENGTDRISQVESYQEVLSRNPIPTCDAAAKMFVNRNQKAFDDLNNQWQLGNRSFPIFTSDYGLYWWDYQSGYDLVLAQLGWNNTVAQEIGLVRGAANLQGKRWGTIITWKYTQPPYLTDGDEMYEQMRTSYESGAEYVIVFNYAENMTDPYGTLRDEHFQALERFWNDVVWNPDVVYGGIKAEAALVLPRNFGWGMRNPQDTIWGLWSPNSTSQQIWTLLRDNLARYGSRLDIVYDDPAYPATGKYSQIYFWNQTS